MAAGLGFKTFVTGEVLTAADTNGYLMQGINVFATTAARDAAITAPAEGQFAFTKDTNSLWYYDGAAWVASGATGDIEGVTAGIGISGGGTSGTVTVTNSMATAIDAKGDLVAGTGADAFSRLAVGANDTVLTADSAQATGLKWATPASGGMTLLSTTALSGSSSTTISSISQSYTNLYISMTGLICTAGTWSMTVIPNNSTSLCNYSNMQEGSIQSTSAGNISPGNSGHSASSAVNDYALTFFDYASTTARKPFMLFGLAKLASSATPVGVNCLGAFNSTSALSSIVISNDAGNFTGGSVRIYGVK